MNAAPRNGKFIELICIKSKSIIHIDWGNVEIIQGKTYKNYLDGFGYLKENICDSNSILIEVGGQLWPFPQDHFSTIREIRDKKINEILDEK